jgi:hypothetical protein
LGSVRVERPAILDEQDVDVGDGVRVGHDRRRHRAVGRHVRGVHDGPAVQAPGERRDPRVAELRGEALGERLAP